MAVSSINVFFSYAHEDEDLRDALAKHLKILKRQGTINTWYDRDIEIGQEWDAEIKAQLEAANIILLLVSPDFLASDYCWDVEVETALRRHHDPNDPAAVVPVILRPCKWTGTPFAKLQAVPKNGTPVVAHNNHDEAFLYIANSIDRLAQKLKKQ